MYIHHRPAAAIFRLATGALAAAGVGLQFVIFGSVAWRLFSTWTLLLTAFYFVVIALISAFWSRRSLGKQNSPVLEGAIIVANIIMLAGAVYSWQVDQPSWWINNVGMMVLYFLVPIMTLLDYCLFCRKGRFHIIFPIDWLAFPIIYTALILLTALNHLSALELAIPYRFLNYEAIGFNNFALSLIIIAILVLVFGYLFFVIDLILSGKLAKQIVLPKLKAVVIEEVPASSAVEAAVSSPVPPTTPAKAPDSSAESSKSNQTTKTNGGKTAKTASPKTTTKPKTKAITNNTKSKKSSKAPSSQGEQQQSAAKASSAKSRNTTKSRKPAGRKPKNNPNPKGSRPQLGVKNRPEVQAAGQSTATATSITKVTAASSESSSTEIPQAKGDKSESRPASSPETPKIRKF